MKLLLALLVAAGLPIGGPAHRKTMEGNERYENGEYEQALQAYTEAQLHEPEAPELYYDIGNVLYRQEDYVGAEEAFARGLAAASSSLAPRAAYNLGNAFFRQGAFDKAAAEYRRALKLDPADGDAKRNLELALRKLEEEQQQQQNQNQDDQEKNEPDQEQEQDREEQGDPRQEEQQQDAPEQQDRQDDAPSQDPRQNPQPTEPDEQPGEMTPEQAARLLDALADQEKENLKRQLKAKLAGRRGTEKDW